MAIYCWRSQRGLQCLSYSRYHLGNPNAGVSSHHGHSRFPLRGLYYMSQALPAMASMVPKSGVLALPRPEVLHSVIASPVILEVILLSLVLPIVITTFLCVCELHTFSQIWQCPLQLPLRSQFAQSQSMSQPQKQSIKSLRTL